MPAASITATSAQAFVVPARAFGYEIKNVSDTTVYLRHAKTVATSGSTMGMPLEPGERRTFAFRHKLNHELTVMGIHGGSGSKSVVWDTLDQEVVAAGGVNSTANVTLSAGDIEIGAVELKNASTDERASIEAANTVRTNATKVLAVQHVDAAGNVLPASPVIGAGSAAIGSVKDGGPAWTTSRGIAGARFSSADQSAAVASVTDAPTAGQKLVITDLLISSDTALRLDFNIESSATVIETVYMAANETKQITVRSQWKLGTADKKLQVQASAAGNISITPFYFSEA